MGFWDSLFHGFNEAHLREQDNKLKNIEKKLDNISESRNARFNHTSGTSFDETQRSFSVEQEMQRVWEFSQREWQSVRGINNEYYAFNKYSKEIVDLKTGKHYRNAQEYHKAIGR